MANTPYGTPPASERWNVNMPAVIGVVFVFLLGVIIWVITSTGDDDRVATTEDSAATTEPSTTLATTTTVPGTTTPAPMPDLSSTTLAAPVTAPPATSPPTVPATSPPTTTTPPPPTTTTTAAPPTTAAGADPGAPLGDLAIEGFPMQAPPCDGGFITIIASAVGEQATADGIGAVLEQYPGSNYLRTDQTCSSLNPSVNGQPIYVVYFGPFPFASDACAARADGTQGSYARQLSNDVPPSHQVDCPST
jgi:cytoskeletal protein RodZ